jgi:hypothetical protein
VLAVATAVAYAIAFLYQWGYALQFGIPAELIVVSVTSVFIALAALLGPLLFMAFVAWASGLFDSTNPFRPLSDPHEVTWMKVFPVYVITLLALVVSGLVDDWKPATVMLSISLILSGWVLGGPALFAVSARKFRRHDRPTNFRDAVVYFHERDRKNKKLAYWWIRLVESGYYPTIVFTTALGALAFTFGHYAAVNESHFYVDVDRPTRVVLRIYGDTVVFGRRTSCPGVLARTLTYAHIGDGDLNLRRDDLGQLRFSSSQACR